MSNRRFFLILAAAALLSLLVLYLINRGKGPYSWQENFKEFNNGPYGVSVLYALLQEYFPEQPFYQIKKGLISELPAKPAQASSYIFVGEETYWDSLEVNALLRFVRQGNQAFIASRHVPDFLVRRLYKNTCSRQKWDGFYFISDTLIRLNFFHPDLKMDSVFRLPYRKPYDVRETRPKYMWDYMEGAFFCGNKRGFEQLGHFNRGLINFARVPYGQGWIYLHTTPIAFTNLALLEPNGRDYAERAFSTLPPGPVYWDVISKNPGRTRAGEPGWDPDRRLSGKSPLDYILRQPALAFAWYLILLTGLLFLLFRTKRRQRPVPVLLPNRNTSLEFVLAIGRLNFLKRYHKKIAQQQMKYLLQFLRERYQVNTRDLDEEFAILLSQKIQLEPEHIRSLVQFYQNIERGSIVTDNTLMEFHQRIDALYRHSKQHSLQTHARKQPNPVPGG